MNLFKKKNESGRKICLCDKSRQSKLLFDLKMRQYRMVEVMAIGYLKQCGVEYCNLEDEECYAIMIGAAKASEFAKALREVKADSAFGGMFIGFLKNIIPHDTFKEIDAFITNGISDDKSTKVRNMLMDKAAHTKFEAYARVLAMVVAAFVQSQGDVDQIQDALWNLFVYAKSNYETDAE